MNTELNELWDILKEEWCSLTEEGFTFDGFETVHSEGMGGRRWTETIWVVTQGPSGAYYGWEWERALTEHQEHYYEDHVPPVPVEKTC